jgi:trehalose 6-phosphate phosphatase
VDLLARLAEEPSRAAVLLDVDGTLAPIVPRPEDARVPPETQAELRRLYERYALVACISGRSAQDARRVVAVSELTYVGDHGLGLDPKAPEWRGNLNTLLAKIGWPDTETKEFSAALHYRNADDELAARAELEGVAALAERDGFVTRFGRKVLEILPPLEANKGTVVRKLLAERALRRALYAGDDTTDLDAFAALDGLEVGVRIAVSSLEEPTQLVERADVVVDSPRALAALLARL